MEIQLKLPVTIKIVHRHKTICYSNSLELQLSLDSQCCVHPPQPPWAVKIPFGDTYMDILIDFNVNFVVYYSKKNLLVMKI